MGRRTAQRGFTIVELIAVIVIIGILSILVLNTITGAQKHARDAVRSDDIHTIVGFLISYNTVHDGLPKPASYGESNSAGYDVSSQGAWLPFLAASTNGKLPKDPLNNITGDPTVANAGFAYFYTCYKHGVDPDAPDPNEDVARIGYRSEATNQLKTTDMKVGNCQ